MLYNLNKQVKILRFLRSHVQRKSPTVYSQSKKMAISIVYMIQCGGLSGSCKWINFKVKTKLI